MAPTKKFTVLNMQQRLDVLKDLQEGSLPIIDIVIKYGIHPITIQRIKRNAEKINAFADKGKHERKRQRIKVPVYAELDKHLLEWFMERRALHVHLTDALMLKKARELKDNLPSCSRSKLSYGWLVKFKKRHGIRLIHIRGEKAIATQDATDIFVDDFKETIEEENKSLENIYNMDKRGLVRKTLPSKTLAIVEEM